MIKVKATLIFFERNLFMSTAAYSISKVSKDTGLEAHTLRFYEKEGIISPKRTQSGIRYFSEDDLERLSMICCLKRTGMTLKDIKTYFDLVALGDSTLQERHDMFIECKERVLGEIQELESHLETVNWKINYYQRLIDERESGTAQA